MGLLKIVLILFRIFSMYYCVTKAKALNRNPLGWAIFAFILPVIAFIWIQFVKPQQNIKV